MPGSKRRETKLGVSIGNTRKRKSHASKRSVTTFIQADMGNFRRMVQEVTGVKLPMVKPELIWQPFVNRLQRLLPTLDISDYLLQLQCENRQQIQASNGFSEAPVLSQVLVNDGDVLDLFSLCSYIRLLIR
ncbi:hypothetical protein R6Q57_016355 [Mikania cordata]